MGPDAWCGSLYPPNVPDLDYKMLIDFSREHDLYCSCLFPEQILLDGPISAIEEEIRVRCEYGKSFPKFGIGIGVVDYWTPQSHLDAAVAAAKKYGKY